jgi:Cu2+-exporting ATPase
MHEDLANRPLPVFIGQGPAPSSLTATRSNHLRYEPVVLKGTVEYNEERMTAQRRHGHDDHGSHTHDDAHGKNDTHGEHDDHHAHMLRDFRRRFFISLALTLPILFLAPMIREFIGLDSLQFTGDRLVLFALSTLVFLYGGWPFLTGWFDEMREKNPGMMTLIGLAVTVAWGYSSAVAFGLAGRTFFWELATLIDIMLLGHWIEMRSVMGASRALEELVKLMPAEAHRLDENGDAEDVRIDQLEKNDLVLVKPGEKMPGDGVVVEGNSAADESMITGESMPVEKSKDDQVIGGSVNGEASLKVRIEKTGEDSYLSQVVDLVRNAQQSRSRAQGLADRAARWLTGIAISAGLITLFAWWFGAGSSFVFSLERMVTVMVITCPHALGLAVPLVVAVSTSLSARNGLLLRDRNGFERARNVSVVLFDKTGTLTEGSFGVTDVIVFDDELDKDAILRMAAAVERESEHPIARSIVEAAKDIPAVKEFTSIPGKGAKGIVDGQEILAVSRSYVEEENIDYDANSISDAADAGKTLVFVVADGRAKGMVALADRIREESREALQKLRDMGIESRIVTGDNENVARWVAEQLGIDTYYAGVLPDKKAEIVEKVREEGHVVAMTGDGVNDAPALATADVGIAIGSGTDVAAETADVVLVNSSPLDVERVIALSKATYRKMLQNLAWATGYNVIAIPLAAGALAWTGILLSPAVGAVLMSLSTVVVAINARFLKVS